MRFILQILLIAIGAISFFVYVMPQYKDMSSLKAQVVEYDNALNNAKELQQKRDEILASYNSVSNLNKDRLEKLLPDIDQGKATSGSIALILEIDKIASNNGIRITDLSFTDSTKGNESKDLIEISSSDYITSTVSFKMQSTYTNFLAFVDDLEKNLRIVDIKRINFSVPTPTRDKPNVNTNLFEYSFDLQSYWLKNNYE
jgi:hypothetical protein